MFRAVPSLLLLLVLPVALASPILPRPVEPAGLESPEQSQARFQHREARIREALEHGDLTPAEAELLRRRLALHRERLERWRQRLEKQREAPPTVAPVPSPGPPPF